MLIQNPLRILDAQAAAKAQAFYQHLLAASSSGPRRPEEIHDLSIRERVVARAPTQRGDTVVIAFKSIEVYGRPGPLGGSEGNVELAMWRPYRRRSRRPLAHSGRPRARSQ